MIFSSILFSMSKKTGWSISSNNQHHIYNDHHVLVTWLLLCCSGSDESYIRSWTASLYSYATVENIGLIKKTNVPFQCVFQFSKKKSCDCGPHPGSHTIQWKRDHHKIFLPRLTTIYESLGNSLIVKTSQAGWPKFVVEKGSTNTQKYNWLFPPVISFPVIYFWLRDGDDTYCL